MVSQVVLIKNPVDDIASHLGISSNMLIKAAIAKISFFSIFSTIKHANNKRTVCMPIFSWSKNQIRPCLKSYCEWFIWNSIWLLHLAAFRQMIPYFFAAGHFNYARYSSYYLHSMEKLPQHVLDHFLKGEHIMHHLRRLWNGIRSDQFIESTFMRLGHSSGGIIGITLKPEAFKVWALSRHIRCQILMSIMSLKEIDGEDNQIVCQMHHTEEGNGRIISDAKDREGLR